MYTIRGIANIMSLFLTLNLFKIFLETIPTLKPAKSNLFFAYTPGISAVSPPINLQFEILQPLKIPFKIFLIFLGLVFQLQCNLKKIMVLLLVLLDHLHT